MDKSDVVLLLAFAGTYDYRKTGDADVEAWHLAVGDLDFEDAKAAIVAHYRGTDQRMMPFHVRQGVKVLHEERRRLEPDVSRRLPSRFETDEERAQRARAGVAQVQDVINQLADRMSHHPRVPEDALEQLRQVAGSPAIEGGDL